MTRHCNIQVIFFMILAAMIFLGGCSKPAPASYSIVGTWTATTINQNLLVNNASRYDTTVNLPSGSIVFSFTASGYYTLFQNGNTTGSGYLLNGNTLSLYDTSGTSGTWASYKVSTLTASNFSFQISEPLASDSQLVYTYNLIR